MSDSIKPLYLPNQSSFKFFGTLPRPNIGMESYQIGKSQDSIRVIEWHMMDKSKFYPLSFLSSFSIRILLYPFTVVRTRLQIQQHRDMYNGMFDAFSKIRQTEGFMTLYKGFWVGAFQLVSGALYVTTYETVRHNLDLNGVHNNRIKTLVGGALASVVGQTVVVPFDVLSQHVMVLGMAQGKSKKVVNPLNIDFQGKSRAHVFQSVVKEVYKRGGLAGFYKGYLASLTFYVPNSALWWTFYHFYQDHLEKALPASTSSLALQCVSASLGGITSSLLTNPLDTIRARLQVHGKEGYIATARTLWREERYGCLYKGLSPRLFQSLSFSWIMVLMYESVKRLSVKDDYKSYISW